jgi:hypothetical protein
MSTPPSLVHPREFRTKACQCEHESHFPEPAILGHAFGVEFRVEHMQTVRTPWGKVRACPACRDTCLSKYEVTA